MTKQSFQVDPNHTHSYRKLTRIGVDDDDKWGSPEWVDVVDDADTYAGTAVDLEAAGVTVATAETSTPN